MYVAHSNYYITELLEPIAGICLHVYESLAIEHYWSVEWNKVWFQLGTV